MKKLITYCLIAGVAALASCKKDNNSTGTTNPIGSDVKLAPDGFNFATTKSVNINISLKTNDNNPIAGVVVSVYLPDTTIARRTVYKGVTDKNGTVTATVTVPTQYTQLVIDPAYVGLLRNALANIRGTGVTAVIGGFSGFSGDIVASTVTPSTASSTFSIDNKHINSASATEYAYPSPYTSTSNAVASPTANGVPNYLDPTNDAISSSLLSYVNASLPEGSAVPDTHPQYISTTAVNVINVTATTDIYVTFVSEGAGFYNTLGWYSYATGSAPTAATGGTNASGINKVTMVFPNASASGSGGGLVSGNRVKLGTFNAGTTIAFCLLQNAWTATTSNNTTTYGINLNGTKFYSQDALNPETTASLKRHQVLLYDNVNNVFVSGFEDVNRTQGQGSDNDFNDLVYYVKSSVSGAISTNGVATIDKGGDTDGDGVQDSQDYFPNDPTRAYSVGSPLYSIAFEDNFPNKGDYDMNDLVTSTSYALESNAQNQLVDMIFYTSVPAAGASFKDGFGIQLTGIASSKVSSVTGQQLISNYITLASNGVEANQTYATIIPFDNYNALINNPNGSFFINTVQSIPKVTSNVATVTVTFTSPLPQSTLTGLNPFIICNLKRGYEAHLPGYLPTDLANKALFGTGDDTSSPTANRYYLSAQNYPWALLFVGAPYQWPIERTSILTAYPHFVDWAASGGSSYTDWYSNTSAGYRVSSGLFQ